MDDLPIDFVLMTVPAWTYARRYGIYPLQGDGEK